MQQDDDSGGEDKDEEEADDPIAALEVLEAADENDPTYLLYPPLALRTPRQKRTQIVLLGELVLDIQRAFNHHLDRLHAAKEDCMDKARRDTAGVLHECGTYLGAPMHYGTALNGTNVMVGPGYARLSERF